MDYSLLIQPVINSLWYFLPILVFILFVRSPWFKGKVGEGIVNLIVKLSLNNKQYHLIKNITLPTSDGGSTQIDHVVVSPFGLFVVETKNMKGWIFGSAKQKWWTQKFRRKSYQFQNPLHQNHKHVKVLQELLKLEDDQIFSVVVFVGDCKLKSKTPQNVTRDLGYVRYIKSKKQKVLNDETITKIVSEIETGRLTASFATNREHVRYVRDTLQG